MMKRMAQMNRASYIVLVMLCTAAITIIPAVLDVLTYTIRVEAQSPSVDASNVYDTKSMTLGSNIKNLVILIPNEAHESQHLGHPTAEQRHINQPYIPQDVTVTKGTAVVWFNGDVDHDRKITLTGQDPTSNSILFDSDTFEYNTATQPITMNDTGSFTYFEEDVNDEDPDFVMNGTINVVDQANNATTATAGATTELPITNIDTVGTLMVPTEDLATYTSDLENSGFSILSTHDFEDIRGEDQQTLMVWATASTANSMGDIVSKLIQITSELPYG